MNRLFCHITSSSKTGAEDDICPGQSIIYDDFRYKIDTLDKADDYICKTYRRGSNNGFFNGDFFIILSNDTFDDAFSYFFVDKDGNETTVKRAAYSRFYRLKVFDGNVEILGKNTRETVWKDEKDLKFEQFMEKFSYYIKQRYEMMSENNKMEQAGFISVDNEQEMEQFLKEINWI